MKDTHIHLENGPYTIEWLNEFVENAMLHQLEEIWLVEHSYRFIEFEAMYKNIRANNAYFEQYYQKRGSLYHLNDYLQLIEKVKQQNYPITIKFGLEVCFIEGNDNLVKEIKSSYPLDFLIGSIHFIGNFCFDHNKELWQNLNVDQLYASYFESTINLIESGLFDILGHVDSIKLFNHRPNINLLPYYQRIIEALKNRAMMVEQNSGIERRSPSKPELGINHELLSLIIDNKIPITYSSDAHYPQDVGYKLNELKLIVDNITKSQNV